MPLSAKQHRCYSLKSQVASEGDDVTCSLPMRNLRFMLSD